MQRMDLISYPRLDTILKVEKIIEKEKEPMKKNAIFQKLNKSVKWVTLNIILEYLEDLGKIAELKEGYLWIWEGSMSEKLKKKFKEAVWVR